jgi:transcriptional regulator with XRE-family HTH domain
MKPGNFELKIIKVVTALRKQKGLALLPVAACLNMSESYYWKIENGWKALSLEQLNTIANYYKTSVAQIILMAQLISHDSIGGNPFATSIAKQILLLSRSDKEQAFSYDEVQSLFAEIFKC